MPDIPPVIEWSHLTQPEFDQRIEALVRAEFPDSLVEPRNGRGGDGGIDILLTEPGGRRTIFQLKFFLDGFTGGWAQARRPQIKKSYRSAMNEKPDRWILVYPGTLTESESRFVDGLEALDDHQPERLIWSRADLDVRFAQHLELAAYFSRNQFQHLVELHHGELAAIGHVMTDLPGRLRGLGQTLDALDPDWAIDFARTGGQRTVTFRPKHSASHIISPISFRPIIREDRLPPDAAAAIRRSRDFGLDSQVSISEPALLAVEIDGPPWLSSVQEGGTVEWRVTESAVRVGTAVELRFPDARASFAGTIAFGGYGSQGYSLRVSIGVATVELLIPRAVEDPGDISFSYTLGDASGVFDALQPASSCRLSTLAEP